MLDIPPDIIVAAEKAYHRTHSEFRAWVPSRSEPDVFEHMERAILAERNRILESVEAAWAEDMQLADIVAIIENRT